MLCACVPACVAVVVMFTRVLASAARAVHPASFRAAPACSPLSRIALVRLASTTPEQPAPAATASAQNESARAAAAATGVDAPAVVYRSSRAGFVRFLGTAAISQFTACLIASPLVLFVGRDSAHAALNALAPRIALSAVLVGGGALLLGGVSAFVRRYVVELELLPGRRARITNYKLFGKETLGAHERVTCGTAV